MTLSNALLDDLRTFRKDLRSAGKIPFRRGVPGIFSEISNVLLINDNRKDDATEEWKVL